MLRIRPADVNAARAGVTWVLRALSVGLLAWGAYLVIKRLVFGIAQGDPFTSFVAFMETGEGDARRHRARFFSTDAASLRDLFELVGPVHGTEVLIDDRPVPYTRELWLPLLWFHLLP